MEELVIIGSGCAGYAAAIYAARAELKPVVFEGTTPVMDWLIYICWSTITVLHIANTCIRP